MSRVFVSPGRYIQGEGVLSELGSYADQFGSHMLLLADETVLGIVRETVEQSLSDTDCALTIVPFRGECTIAERDRVVALARDVGADIIAGAGGGKAIDTAKAVRAVVGGAMFSLPTIASTDAPTSGLSITYDADGRFEGALTHESRPELVLVDIAVIAAAPTRLFVSGIGDALATEYEAAAVAATDSETVAGGKPTRASTALVECCGEILRSQGAAAVEAVERNDVTDDVADVTEAIIFLSGLGFENGGLAAAHAIHDGISTVVESDTLHGEKVCIGLLTQLILEERPDWEIQNVASFAAAVGLPTTLAEVHIDRENTAQVTAVAEAACRRDGTMVNQPSDPGPADVADALLAVDEIGRSLTTPGNDA